MTTHIIKPGVVSSLGTRCGMLLTDATDADLLGSEDGITDVDCVGCLRGLIISMRMAAGGGKGPEYRWLYGGDTGISSITIWSVLMREPMPRGYFPDVPHDPADLGRCIRLLEEIPAWRARLPEVSDSFDEWTGLVEHWDELSGLYAEEAASGRAPRTWERMKEVGPR